MTPLRRVSLLAFLLLAGAGPAYPVAPEQGQDPAAFARAEAAWRNFAALAEAKAPAEKLQVGAPRCWRIRQAVRGSVAAGSALHWTFFDGVPPEGAGQKLRKAPAGKVVAARDGQPLVTAEAKSRAKDPLAAAHEWVFEIEARPRHLAPSAGAPKVDDLAPKAAKPWLAATASCDWAEPGFQAWLDRTKLRPEPRETECRFARRVVRVLISGRIWRDDPGTETRLAKVPEQGPLCCWEAALRAVGALRAAGIPARACVGYFTAVPANYTDPKQANAHIRLEFFARGIGWVPADATPPLRAPAGAGAFEALLAARVGHDDGSFIVLHHDLDLVWKGKGEAQTFRMMPGVNVDGDNVAGPLKFEQVWKAEAIAAER